MLILSTVSAHSSPRASRWSDVIITVLSIIIILLTLGCVTVTTIVCKQEKKWLQENETLSSAASDLPLPIPVPAAGNIDAERTQSIWCYLNRPQIVVHSFLFIYLFSIFIYKETSLHCFVKKSYFFSKCPDKNSIGITLLSCLERTSLQIMQQTPAGQKNYYILLINFYDQRRTLLWTICMGINKM